MFYTFKTTLSTMEAKREREREREWVCTCIVYDAILYVFRYK